MMHGREKSDSAIVAGKPTNKAEQSAAEPVEPRAEAEGNASQQSTCRAQDRESVSQALERIRQAARQRKKEKFTALFHHLTIDLLEDAFDELKKDAAAGVDGLTWKEYDANLERQSRGSARATPSGSVPGAADPASVHTEAGRPTAPARGRRSRRQDRPEGDGRGAERDLRGRLPRVLVRIPTRTRHARCAGRALVGITSRKVNFILDADIQSFFDTVSHDWLVRFVEHRIGDPRIVRLIRKWLKAGVLEDGVVTDSDKGTGQGSVISPLLANIYLHYVIDLWAERWRRREATGDMIIVRYADDIIVGFEHETDARRFLDAMRERLGKFALSLHPDKTRLIEFGRYAADRRARRGLGKPESFSFLGFTFICGKSRQGIFQLKRKTRRDRMRAKLRAIKQEMRRRMHQPIPLQGKWLQQVVSGYFNYHAVPTNSRALHAFRHFVAELWQRSLRRRSQKHSMTWERITQLANDWLPKPRILHPWPERRFAVTHPRWEPYA